MADPGAIKAGDAYIEMTLDKGKLDKDIADAGQTADNKTQATADRRMKQLESKIWKMTGAFALINVATNAIAGAFAAIEANKSMDTAMRQDNLAGMVTAMRKAEDASTAFLRKLPLIGSMLGSIIDLFKDRSIEEWAQDVEKADDKGQALAKTLDDMAAAQIRLAQVSGVSPGVISEMAEAEKMRKIKEDIGQKNQTYIDAEALAKKTAAARDAAANEKVGWGEKTTVGEARSKGGLYHAMHIGLDAKEDRLAVLEAEAQKAEQERFRAKKALNNAMTNKQTEEQIARKEAASQTEIIGMQEGSALAGATASGVAWGVGQAEQASPQEQLVTLQTAQAATLADIKTGIDKIVSNTMKPAPQPYGVH